MNQGMAKIFGEDKKLLSEYDGITEGCVILVGIKPRGG